MKRQLSVQHLLFNASRKPEHVAKWFDDLQKARLESFDLDLMTAPMPYRVPTRDFIEDRCPAIREFDFTKYKPTLLATMHDGLPTIAIAMKIMFALPISSSRKLGWYEAVLNYLPAEKKYRLALILPQHDPELTTADQEALDLLCESVFKPFT